jgi:hypothetical protein
MGMGMGMGMGMRMDEDMNKEKGHEYRSWQREDDVVPSSPILTWQMMMNTSMENRDHGFCKNQ